MVRVEENWTSYTVGGSGSGSGGFSVNVLSFVTLVVYDVLSSIFAFISPSIFVFTDVFRFSRRTCILAGQFISYDTRMLFVVS